MMMMIKRWRDQSAGMRKGGFRLLDSAAEAVGDKLMVQSYAGGTGQRESRQAHGRASPGRAGGRIWLWEQNPNLCSHSRVP